MTKSHVLLEKGVKPTSLELIGSLLGAPMIQTVHGPMALPSPQTTCRSGFHSTCSRQGQNPVKTMSRNILIIYVFPKLQVFLSHSEKFCGEQNYPSRRQVHSDIMSGFPCPSPAPLKHRARCSQPLGKALLVGRASEERRQVLPDLLFYLPDNLRGKTVEKVTFV